MNEVVAAVNPTTCLGFGSASCGVVVHVGKGEKGEKGKKGKKGEKGEKGERKGGKEVEEKRTPYLLIASGTPILDGFGVPKRILPLGDTGVTFAKKMARLNKRNRKTPSETDCTHFCALV